MTRLNQHMTHFEDLVLLGTPGLDELKNKIDSYILSIPYMFHIKYLL